MQLTEELVGRITHMYPKMSVAVLKLESSLNVGDRIRVEAEFTFEQDVEKIQVDKQDVVEAKKGQSIGLKINRKAVDNDLIYKISRTAMIE